VNAEELISLVEKTVEQSGQNGDVTGTRRLVNLASKLDTSEWIKVKIVLDKKVAEHIIDLDMRKSRATKIILDRLVEGVRRHNA
jgi:hypothetical protein